MSLQQAVSQSDIPIRCKTLESMNFTDISIAGTAAVGIGSSVQLTFTFPEIAAGSREDDDHLETIQLTDQKDGAPTSTHFDKVGKTSQVSMYAIPCIDGTLIENEGTLARFLNNKMTLAGSAEGFTVGLMNDF